MRRSVASISTCKICGLEFKYFSSIAPHTCSDTCKKEKTNAYHRSRRQTVEGTLRTITAGCKNRARRKELPCDIDTDFIIALYKQQNGKCARTGITLEPSNASGKIRWNPNTITIDRINSAKGYTKDNVQLVTLMYNNCKSNFTHKDVVNFCKQVIENEKI